MMSKFKVGDKVRILNWDELSKKIKTDEVYGHFGLDTAIINKYSGIATIKAIDDNRRYISYLVIENGYFWKEHMLTCVNDFLIDLE